jgi:hypothetical protein
MRVGYLSQTDGEGISRSNYSLTLIGNAYRPSSTMFRGARSSEHQVWPPKLSPGILGLFLLLHGRNIVCICYLRGDIRLVTGIQYVTLKLLLMEHPIMFARSTVS